MKKLLIILVILVLLYSAYMLYIKQKPALKPVETNSSLPAGQTKTSVTPLTLELKIGETVTIGSKSIPAGEIRLLKIDNFSSAVIQVYKGNGTITKSLDLRKVISRVGTIEVKLIDIMDKKIKITVRISSGPKNEQLEVVRR